MDKAYYKEYYHLEREHWWFLARKEILCSLVKKYLPTAKGNHLKILNVGVATGATSQILEEFGEVTSVEYDVNCCRFLREELKREVTEASLLDLPFPDQYFDLVCAFDVVEHVEDDQTAMNELYRVSRTGGRVILTVPAFMCLWGEHDLVNHHVRRYTYQKLAKLTAGWQAEIIIWSYFNTFLFPAIGMFRILKRLFSSNRKLENELTSDFKIKGQGWFDQLFFWIFEAERHFLLNGFRFPFGVSFLSIWQRGG